MALIYSLVIRCCAQASAAVAPGLFPQPFTHANVYAALNHLCQGGPTFPPATNKDSSVSRVVIHTAVIHTPPPIGSPTLSFPPFAVSKTAQEQYNTNYAPGESESTTGQLDTRAHTHTGGAEGHMWSTREALGN